MYVVEPRWDLIRDPSSAGYARRSLLRAGQQVKRYQMYYGRGCTPEFPATKSKKLVKVPRTQEKEEKKNYERTHLTPPPQIADFPSQRIEPKLKGRLILRDKSVAYSQLWRRSGTLAWPTRATTSPKAARNLRSAIKIDLRTQFHRVFFIATTRQSTSSLINMDIRPFDPPPPLP